MYRILTLSVFLLVAFNLSARHSSAGTVAGRFTDKDASPVIYATVLLYHSPDSMLVKGAMSDTSGTFVFDAVDYGTYYLAVSMPGFEKYFSPAFEIDSLHPGFELGAQMLVSKQLQEVEVVAQKPLFEQRPGMLVVNVENSVVNAGSTAIEILRRTPGVFVDKDGNILLKGKAGVLILIDDKRTYMGAAELFAMLSAMPATSVQSIEVITNPSAKYDAEGTSGIINIRLKREKKQGLNGVVSGGYMQGRYPGYNASTVLNYRTSKFNFFAGADGMLRTRYQDYHIVRKFYDPTELIFDQNDYVTIHTKEGSFRAGADWFINPKNTLGVMVTGFGNDDNLLQDNLTMIYDGSEHTVGNATTTSDEWYRYRNFSYNLNFKTNLDTAGKELTINADYAPFNNRESKEYQVGYHDASGNAISPDAQLRNLFPSAINIFSGKADYSQPLKKGSLEAGVKSSYVNSMNTVSFDSLAGTNWLEDDERSNRFRYSENINAAYLNLNYTIKKMNISSGLRAEHTRTEGYSFDLDRSNRKEYINLFPSLSVQYAVNDTHMFSLAYSRRISRVPYEELNPSIIYVDRFTYVRGNPDLQPSFSNSVDFSYVFRQAYIVNFSYAHNRNEFTEVFSQNDTTHITAISKFNIDDGNFYGLTFSATFSPVSFWQSATNVTGFYMDYRDNDFFDETYYNGKFACQVNSENSFLLPHNLKFQLSGVYVSPMVYGIFIMKPQWHVSAGIEKTFADGKWTLNAGVDDIFLSQRDRITITAGGQDATLLNTRDSRRLKLTLRYRIGKGATIKKRGGNEEEKNRVKGGG